MSDRLTPEQVRDRLEWALGERLSEQTRQALAAELENLLRKIQGGDQQASRAAALRAEAVASLFRIGL